MPQRWRSHWQALRAWLDRHPGWGLPSQCLLCDDWTPDGAVCLPCRRRFGLHAQAPAALRCQACGQRWPGLTARTPHCGTCLRHPPPWLACHVWADYAYPCRELIARWKFAAHPSLARHFAAWMRETPRIAQVLQSVDVLVPVPTGTARLRQRGYNPAAQLASHLGGPRALPFALWRTQAGAPQSSLSRQGRLLNMRRAFVLNPQYRADIQGRRVLLVDDVMTTGATVHAAARVLQRAGPASLQVLCMARTPARGVL